MLLRKISKRHITTKYSIILLLSATLYYCFQASQLIAPNVTRRTPQDLLSDPHLSAASSSFASSRHLLYFDNCTPPAVDQFPKDLFSQEDRSRGAVLVHVLVAVYMFVGIALACDDYFVPACEKFCNSLRLSEDVAGATFMAAGSSAPELATTIIGVFITKDDIGLGSVIGSAVFNVMLVISLCALFAGMVVRLKWWPMCRDCVCYLFCILILVLIIMDEMVHWYEALSMVLLYALYIVLMFFNPRIERHIQSYIRRKNISPPLICDTNDNDDDDDDGGDDDDDGGGDDDAENDNLSNSNNAKSENKKKKNKKTESTYLKEEKIGTYFADNNNNNNNNNNNKDKNSNENDDKINNKIKSVKIKDGRGGVDNDGVAYHELLIYASPSSNDDDDDDDDGDLGKRNSSQNVKEDNNDKNLSDGDGEDEDEESSVWEFPESNWKKVLWFLSLPLTGVMYVTVPDCRRKAWSRWYVVTFVNSCLWIAFYSYMMVWMITVVGYTCGIPDSVMGLTFIAAGSSVPDAVASLIVVRAGQGDMAVSNAIGSNIFDIMVCLGVPWLLQTLISPLQAPVKVFSSGLTYTALTLFATVFILLILTHLNRWRLTKPYGAVLLFFYFTFNVVASLFELNVFGYMNPPDCLSRYDL